MNKVVCAVGAIPVTFILMYVIILSGAVLIDFVLPHWFIFKLHSAGEPIRNYLRDYFWLSVILGIYSLIWFYWWNYRHCRRFWKEREEQFRQKGHV